MAKPVIKAIVAFDASVGTTVDFVFNGNQIYGNHLKIYNTRDNTIAYDKLIENQTGLYHTIPSISGLVNGESYYATISVLERKLVDGTIQLVESTYSDKLLFYCYTTPGFYFEDFKSETTISTSYINLRLIYSQKENEGFSEAKIIVYNESKKELQNSGIIYMGVNNYANYSITGLSNNTSYYIQAIGTTIHGTELDTGLIKVNITYSLPDISAIIDLENDYKNGYIKIISNLRVISSSSSITKLNFIDESMVDLSDGKYIEYNNGFTLDNDFALQIVCKPDDKANNKFLILEGNNSDINFTYNYTKTYNTETNEYEKQYYINVSSECKNLLYTINSKKFTALLNNEMLLIVFKKKNNICSVQAKKITM